MPDTILKKPLWNALTSNWLEVADNNANTRLVSPIEVFHRANEIRYLLSASPLDLFTSYRFLLTILYWQADAVGGVECLRESLIEGVIPSRIIELIEENIASFNLFDPTIPFLQDNTLIENKKRLSAGSLFPELASGTNIAHFHHGHDTELHLCHRCTIIGMLSLIPWSQSGGSGKNPSVHNAPPMMVLANGDNIAMTLGLNLVPLSAPMGTATWTGHFRPTSKEEAIPYMEAFTWNPRRIHLIEPIIADSCWRCGEKNISAIGQIVFDKNIDTAKRSDDKLFEWQDPSAFYPCAGKDKYKTLKSYNEKKAVTGDDIRGLLELKSSPVAAVVANNQGHTDWQLIIPCTNTANNKTFDHRQLTIIDSFTSEALRKALPSSAPSINALGIDGWVEPPVNRHNQGVYHFLQIVTTQLTYSDWAILSAASFHSMEDAVAAFDIFCGIFWSLRGKISGIPSRKVAWLMLKLMAAVPPQARIIQNDASFYPLHALSKRQIGAHGKNWAKIYPRSFPQSHQLEASLHTVLMNKMRQRKPEAIDWIGLCQGLERLYH